MFSSTMMLTGWAHLGRETGSTTLAPTSSNNAFHNPTPLTGTKNRFVPCMNSSLLFILVSGSRCAIRTPSSAFLLCALVKNRTTSILKCENNGTDITPPCFSWMCFQRGLLPLFLSTSSTYWEPLWKMFLPVSPAYFDSTWRLHTMHSYDNPVPFSDILQVAQCCR